MLLTGGDTRYLQHAVAGGDGDGDVATHELWSPAAKLAGRYLTPYLLGRDEPTPSAPSRPSPRRVTPRSRNHAVRMTSALACEA